MQTMAGRRARSILEVPIDLGNRDNKRLSDIIIELSMSIKTVIKYGLNGPYVALRLDEGWMLITADRDNDVCWVDLLRNGHSLRTRSWYPISTFKDLGALLRETPEKKVDFDEVFLIDNGG